MGETKENDVSISEKEQKHGENKDGAGEKEGDKAKDKKKNKKKEKKEKNPEDIKDPTTLKAKLEKIDSKIQVLNLRRQEILKLLEEVHANASASEAGAEA